MAKVKTELHDALVPKSRVVNLADGSAITLGKLNLYVLAAISKQHGVKMDNIQDRMQEFPVLLSLLYQLSGGSDSGLTEKQFGEKIDFAVLGEIGELLATIVSDSMPTNDGKNSQE